MDSSLTLSNLPFEILLDIVNALGGECDPSHRASEALLSLRSTNQRISAVVDKWCDSYAARQLMWKLPNGEVLGLFSKTSLNLVDIYKRIAWICAKCNNRARKYPRVEPFTNLQLCQACDSHYFPKISWARVASYFDLGKDDVLQDWNIPYHLPYNSPAPEVEMGDRIFRLRDIVRLASERKWRPMGNSDNFYQRVVERCGLFEYSRPILTAWIRHDIEIYADEYTPSTQCEQCAELYSRMVLLNFVGLVPAWGPHYTLPPNENWDEVLFNHFRFQFDPTWREDTPDILHEVYSSCVGYWANKYLWERRPWGPYNFPLPPVWGWAYENCELGTEPAGKTQQDLESYRKLCSRLRAGFKAFPNILKSPTMWTSQKLNMATTKWLREASRENRKWQQFSRLPSFEIRLRLIDAFYTSPYIDLEAKSPHGVRLPDVDKLWPPYPGNGFGKTIRIGNPQTSFEEFCNALQVENGKIGDKREIVEIDGRKIECPGCRSKSSFDHEICRRHLRRR